MLACYAPDRIPLHLLSEANAETLDQLDPTAHPPLATLAADPLRLDQAVAALQRYLRPRAWRHRCSTGRDSS